MEPMNGTGKEEKVLAIYHCALPTIVALLIWVGIILLCVVVAAFSVTNSALFYCMIIFAVISLIVLILFVLYYTNLKKCYCALTDRRIYGRKATNLFFDRQYSYSIDEIKSVETENHSLILFLKTNPEERQDAHSFNDGSFEINALSDIAVTTLYNKITSF